jgi:hypothetical protein
MASFTVHMAHSTRFVHQLPAKQRMCEHNNSSQGVTWHGCQSSPRPLGATNLHWVQLLLSSQPLLGWACCC